MAYRHPLPEQSLLKKHFEYNPDTGILIRLTGNYKGYTGACLRYCIVQFQYKKYLASRIIWRIMTGKDPGNLDVEHRDRDKHNNRWCNLRLATAAQNSQNINVTGRKTNTGHKGICFSRGKYKYRVRILLNGKLKTILRTDSFEEAKRAYTKAVKEHRPDFGAW